MGWMYRIVCAGSAGKNKTLSFDISGSADYATALAAGTDILTKFQAVSDAVVQRTTLSFETEFPGTLPANVDTAIVATISGKILSSQKPVTVKFPAPKDTVRLGASGEEYNELDLSLSAITDYWSLFAAAGVALISDGEQVAATPRSSQIIALASRQP